MVRDLIDAVADAMPRQPPVEIPVRRADVVGWEQARADPSRSSYQARLAKHRRVDPTDLPQLVRLSVRVEADEEELVAGAVRLVPQVHDEQNPLHLCDLAPLWTPTPTSTGSATGRAPTRPSRCGRRPTPGRCSTDCWAAGARPAGARHR